MITISLCMIVKDEENVLGRCLESIKDSVDEIIIVDTGSVDKTKDIAKQYTPYVYEFKWQDNFAEARNESFRYATKEYILWLDADDVLLEEDQAKLVQLKENMLHNIDVVMMHYNIEADNRGCCLMSFYRERLIKRDMDMQWIEPVHEVIQIKGNIWFSDISITHKKFGEVKSIRNLKIYENYLHKGKKLSLRGELHYANELFEHQQYEKAKNYYDIYLKQEKDYEGCIHACWMLYQCTKKLGIEDIEYLYKSFKYGDLKSHICYAVGDEYEKINQWEEAAFWYRLALDCKSEEENIGIIYHEYTHFLPHLALCICYFNLGKLEWANYHNEQAAIYNQNHPSVIGNRGGLKSYYESLNRGDYRI